MGADLQRSPQVPQPWVFDQLLWGWGWGTQGTVVSALLPKLTVFVEIQLPASTQEFIPGILYLTLFFSQKEIEIAQLCTPNPHISEVLIPFDTRN